MNEFILYRVGKKFYPQDAAFDHGHPVTIRAVSEKQAYLMAYTDRVSTSPEEPGIVPSGSDRKALLMLASEYLLRLADIVQRLK